MLSNLEITGCKKIESNYFQIGQSMVKNRCYVAHGEEQLPSNLLASLRCTYVQPSFLVLEVFWLWFFLLRLALFSSGNGEISHSSYYC